MRRHVDPGGRGGGRVRCVRRARFRRLRAARQARAGGHPRGRRAGAAHLGPGVRRPGAGRPAGPGGPDGLRSPRRAVAPVLDAVRRQPAGPRAAADGAPRGRLGGRPVPPAAAAGSSRASTRSTRAPRRAGRAACGSARPAGRSSSSRAGRTRRTSARACATARGPTRTTRPTASACASGRGSCACRRRRRRGCATTGAGAPPRGLGAGRDGLPARPGVPGRALGRPVGVGASARTCTRADCDERGECDGRETIIAACWRRSACCGRCGSRSAGSAARSPRRREHATQHAAASGWLRAAFEVDRRPSTQRVRPRDTGVLR